MSVHVQALGDELRAKFAATKAQVLQPPTLPPPIVLSNSLRALCDSYAWFLFLLQALGDELRAKFAATKAQVLAIVMHRVH
jgi:hypothetical protein